MKHKHRPCPCGCGDMADECMAPHAWRNPLGAFQIVEPYTPPTVETETEAEVERLRAERDAALEHVAYHLRDYALNTEPTGDLAVDMAAYAGRMKIRAEAAEAKLARVEALCDRWLEDAENDNIRLEDVARDLTGALAGKRRATPKTPCPECRCLYGTHQKACPGYAQPARADEFEADQ